MVSGPFPPTLFPSFSPVFFPFRGCSFSHHFSPLHLPLIPPPHLIQVLSCPAVACRAAVGHLDCEIFILRCPPLSYVPLYAIPPSTAGNQSFSSALSGPFPPTLFPSFLPPLSPSGPVHSRTTSPLFTSPFIPPFFGSRKSPI